MHGAPLLLHEYLLHYVYFFIAGKMKIVLKVPEQFAGDSAISWRCQGNLILLNEILN